MYVYRNVNIKVSIRRIFETDIFNTWKKKYYCRARYRVPDTGQN